MRPEKVQDGPKPPVNQQVRLTGNKACLPTGSVPGIRPPPPHLLDGPHGRDAEPESCVWIRGLTAHWEKNYAVCQEFAKTENHAVNHQNHYANATLRSGRLQAQGQRQQGFGECAPPPGVSPDAAPRLVSLHDGVDQGLLKIVAGDARASLWADLSRGRRSRRSSRCAPRPPGLGAVHGPALPLTSLETCAREPRRG